MHCWYGWRELLRAATILGEYVWNNCIVYIMQLQIRSGTVVKAWLGFSLPMTRLLKCGVIFFLKVQYSRAWTMAKLYTMQCLLDWTQPRTPSLGSRGSGSTAPPPPLQSLNLSGDVHNSNAKGNRLHSSIYTEIYVPQLGRSGVYRQHTVDQEFAVASRYIRLSTVLRAYVFLHSCWLGVRFPRCTTHRIQILSDRHFLSAFQGFPCLSLQLNDFAVL